MQKANTHMHMYSGLRAEREPWAQGWLVRDLSSYRDGRAWSQKTSLWLVPAFPNCVPSSLLGPGTGEGIGSGISSERFCLPYLL